MIPNLNLNFDLSTLRGGTSTTYLAAAVAVALGVALVVFLLFVTLRFVLEMSVRLYRWMFRRQDPLIADRLAEHLAAVRPAHTVGDRLDRFFERVVGRSALHLTGAQASAYMLLAGVAAGMGLYLWSNDPGFGLLGALAGMLATCVFYGVMHWRWRRQVQEQLPDMFHLLARSLRAGLTVDQSVALMGSQGQQPLAREFQRCAEHLHLGMTVPDAIEMTGERIKLVDFDLLTSLVVLHRQTGGNLPLLVDRLAATVRSRNQFRGHVLAITALGRLSGVCLALAPLMLALFYWVMNPEFLRRMIESPQGLAALGIAAALEVVGVVWLLWLLRVDY